MYKVLQHDYFNLFVLDKSVLFRGLIMRQHLVVLPLSSWCLLDLHHFIFLLTINLLIHYGAILKGLAATESNTGSGSKNYVNKLISQHLVVLIFKQ